MRKKMKHRDHTGSLSSRVTARGHTTPGAICLRASLVELLEGAKPFNASDTLTSDGWHPRNDYNGKAEEKA